MAFSDERWLLPEGVQETLPEDALRLEQARRAVLDLFWRWGYDLVIPPFIEHLDALLTGTGADLTLETFKLTDPVSGRLIGVRADMTPQVARIDAHHFRESTPSRLCYLGTVLRTSVGGPMRSRSPMQLGAELYGQSGIEGDFEVLALMLATLDALGVSDVHLDLGHVGVLRGLLHEERLGERDEHRLLEALQRKSPDELDEALESVLNGETRRRVRALIELNGGHEVLALASERLAGAAEPVLDAIAQLEALVALLDAWGIRHPMHFDLSELRGYQYHTGMVFAALVPGQGHEVARGGRYDDIGLSFGSPRAATGFSTDLKTLVRLGRGESGDGSHAIIAPWDPDPALRQAVDELRRRGERVVMQLPGEGSAGTGTQARCLEKRDDGWVVVPSAQGLGSRQ